MTEYSTSGSGVDQDSPAPPLADNLAALVGALQAPLKWAETTISTWLAYPDREETGGAAYA
jgi:hypothetical protein